MSDASGSDPIAALAESVAEVARELRSGDWGGPAPDLQRPPSPDFGDYSSNAAMLLAAPLEERPREVAEKLKERLAERLDRSLERIEVAGPGFVNIFLSDRWYRDATAALLAAGERLAVSTAPTPQRILVEFVSANPTGPLTAASGRHGAYGDALARLLEAAGHSVEREYYINDTGGQIERFADSVAARMRGEEPPEDGYEGEYVGELARTLAAEGVDASDSDAIARRAVELMVEGIRASLHRYRVDFDHWTSERSLQEEGRLERVLEELRASGYSYESEAAIWLRTTQFGDDKDRVLLRAGGEPTYFASDVAYHADKLGRGYDSLIAVLGADHHGYVSRMHAAIQALGAPAGVYEAPLIQLVQIVESGERSQMSKRRGEFVTLDELIDDIGVDATRFFMLQRSHDSAIDLDLDLARSESSENPVYYVQYAHARIASILRKAGDDAVGDALNDRPDPVEASLETAEKALIKRLLELREEVRESAGRRAPHRICAYAQAAAADFHAFYRDCKVIGAEGEGVERARLQLCVVTKRAIAASLGLLGISAPERM